MTPNPKIKLFSLLLCNGNDATVMTRDAHIRYAGYLICHPCGRVVRDPTTTLEGTHPEGSEVTMPSQDQEEARRVRTQSLAVQTQHQHWLYALGKEGNKQ